MGYVNFFVGLMLMFVPLGIVWLCFRRIARADQARSRSPFSEKLLRPPGESLRVKIGVLEDEFAEMGLVLTGLLILPGFALMQSTAQSASGMLLAYLSIPCLCYALAILQWRKLVRLRRDLRNHRLGFDGERYVGAELNQLMRQGYYVYHDFVYDRKPGGTETDFNFDHIVIGPNGVFLIETKARRKPKIVEGGGQPSHKVIYDGTCLKFPDGFVDRKPIVQAARNAETLTAWLDGGGGSKLHVEPVVAMPGWYVDHQKERGELKVLSGKGLRSALPALGSSVLDDETVRRIAARIEDHCRDVEGE